VDESQQQLGAAIAQFRRIGTDPLISNINWYLSRAHRDDIDCGCAIAGFAGEAPHLSKPAQVSYAEAVESTLNQTANILAEKDSNLTRERAYARAIALYSHMVGSVLLSRANLREPTGPGRQNTRRCPGKHRREPSTSV
jgi:TetR/AcrR family transcriptional repressor of nem operon